MSGTIPKPLLRGHLNRNVAKSLIIGVSLSAVAAVLFKTLYADPKKKRYAEFYKDYDPMVDFRRMRDLGLLQSAKPGEKD